MEVQNRPVYVSSNNNDTSTEFDVVLFTGRRWILTSSSAFNHTIADRTFYFQNMFHPYHVSDYTVAFVSGAVDVQRTNFGGIFDYGEGDCDNQATFTFNNGETVEITLN